MKEKKKIFFSTYYEDHHILPKCVGGCDKQNNLVLLTTKEHFICHKLLTYIYKGNYKLVYAFHKMTHNKFNGIVSSKDYMYAKELRSKTPVSEDIRKKLSKANMNHIVTQETRDKISKNNALFWLDKKQSKEMCDKRSRSLKGRPSPMKNKKHTEEAKEKQRIAVKGKNNPMFGKSVYEVWIYKYGKEEAEKREQKRREKIKLYHENKNNSL